MDCDETVCNIKWIGAIKSLEGGWITGHMAKSERKKGDAPRPPDRGTVQLLVRVLVFSA